GFEIAVELQDRNVIRVLTMGCKNAVQAGQNSVLPMNESTVTIEGKDFEAAEIEHGRWLISQIQNLRLKPWQYRSFLARFTGRFGLSIRLRDRGRILGSRSGLGRKKLCAVQQRTSQGRVVTGPGALEVGLPLEVGA